MSFKKDDEMFKSLSKYRVACKYSHTVSMVKADRLICNHCGNWIYRTPELEFRYKVLEEMKKSDKNE